LKLSKTTVAFSFVTFVTELLAQCALDVLRLFFQIDTEREREREREREPQKLGELWEQLRSYFEVSLQTERYVVAHFSFGSEGTA
jgi:hypothetical protein